MRSLGENFQGAFMPQSGQGGPQPPPPVDPRFVHLLTRWDNEVRYVEKQAWDAQKTAQEFAKLGLSSALVLNAGALLALPPLMQWLSYQGRTQVAHQASWFLTGVISTAVAIAVAYINWMLIRDAQETHAIKRARELDCGYVGKDVKNDEDHIAASNRPRWLPRVVNGTAIIATLCALSAFVFFGIGVSKFIGLAEHNAIAPVTTDASASSSKPTPNQGAK